MAFVNREAMRLLALGGFFRFMPMDEIAETLGGKLIGRGGAYRLRLGMQRLKAPGWKYKAETAERRLGLDHLATAPMGAARLIMPTRADVCRRAGRVLTGRRVVANHVISFVCSLLAARAPLAASAITNFMKFDMSLPPLSS